MTSVGDFPRVEKIRATLTTAQRQAGERVLEGLLKAEEFEGTQDHRWVKAQSAFIGAESRVELHSPRRG